MLFLGPIGALPPGLGIPPNVRGGIPLRISEVPQPTVQSPPISQRCFPAPSCKPPAAPGTTEPAPEPPATQPDPTAVPESRSAQPDPAMAEERLWEEFKKYAVPIGIGAGAFIFLGLLFD